MMIICLKLASLAEFHLSNMDVRYIPLWTCTAQHPEAVKSTSLKRSTYQNGKNTQLKSLPIFFSIAIIEKNTVISFYSEGGLLSSLVYNRRYIISPKENRNMEALVLLNHSHHVKPWRSVKRSVKVPLLEWKVLHWLWQIRNPFENCYITLVGVWERWILSSMYGTVLVTDPPVGVTVTSRPIWKKPREHFIEAWLFLTK